MVMKELEIKIREALPHLKELVKGQRFMSKYYGIITATKITDWGKGAYSIYGFDELEGLPRDCYYPRDLELLGFPIMLNDVISYVKMNEGEVRDVTDDGLIAFYKDLRVAYWDLSSVYFSEQCDSLVEFLDNL